MYKASPEIIGDVISWREYTWQLKSVQGWMQLPPFIIFENDAKHILEEHEKKHKGASGYKLANTDMLLDIGSHSGVVAMLALERVNIEKVVCVEPCPHTCAIVRKNLEHWGERAVVVERALHHRPEVDLSLNVHRTRNFFNSPAIGHNLCSSLTRAPSICIRFSRSGMQPL